MIFCHMAILSSGRIELFLRSSVSYQSMLAQWKSDGFIPVSASIETRTCMIFCHIAILSSWKDKTLFRILCFISKHVSSVEERRVHNP